MEFAHVTRWRSPTNGGGPAKKWNLPPYLWGSVISPYCCSDTLIILSNLKNISIPNTNTIISLYHPSLKNDPLPSPTFPRKKCIYWCVFLSRAGIRMLHHILCSYTMIKVKSLHKYCNFKISREISISNLNFANCTTKVDGCTYNIFQNKF